MTTEAQTCTIVAKKNAGRFGLNWLYTKYYRLTTNRHRSTSVESPLQIHLFLCKTNPISWIPKMNVNSVKTKDYGNESPLRPPKNKPKTNPIKPKDTKAHLTAIKWFSLNFLPEVGIVIVGNDK